MGLYLNPDNKSFAGNVTDEIFVDKSDMIRITNRAIGKSDSNRIVTSRPRRFGKTMAIRMLTAYYSRGCDSKELFGGLAIARDPSFETHLNRHNVIRIDIQTMYWAAERKHRLDDFRQFISETVNRELAVIYPDEVRGNEKNLVKSLKEIYNSQKSQFIFLIDEWDVIYREEKNNDTLKRNYTKLLKELFKGTELRSCFELVYMTGILPIPIQETQSGLNNFRESTMLNPGLFGSFFGFTEPEVVGLCETWGMSTELIKKWYEGYWFNSIGFVYCPLSVAYALTDRQIANYWVDTAVATELFNMMSSTNPTFQKTVRDLMLGQSVPVRPMKIDFSNLKRLNDILIALIHLGYLSYNESEDTASIPNQEITEEFMSVLETIEYSPTYEIISRSEQLLKDTLNRDADAVADAIQKNHSLYCTDETYNRESILQQLILFSYYFATDKYYDIFQELPAGKGFADIAFIPKFPGRIPVVVELKYDKDVAGAIQQIKDRKYTDPFKDFSQVLLVSISYERDSKKDNYKKHTADIELMDMI